MGHLWFGSTTTFFRRRLAASQGPQRGGHKHLEFTTCIVTQQKYGIGLKIFWIIFLFLMVNHYKYSCASLKLMGYLFKILPLLDNKKLPWDPSSWANLHPVFLTGNSWSNFTALNTSRIREKVSGYGLRIYPAGNYLQKNGQTSFPDHLGRGRCYLPNKFITRCPLVNLT